MLIVITLTALGAQQTPAVYRVSIDEISATRLEMVHAALAAAQRQSGVVWLNLPGVSSGNDDAATSIARAIIDSPVNVYAFVADRAWEGAALVALAADSLYVAAGASIGADPSRASVSGHPDHRAVAGGLGAVGPDRAMIMAMFDPSHDLAGSPSGTRVTLTGSALRAAGLAAGVVESASGALTRAGLDDADPNDVEESWLGTTVRITNRNSRDIRVFVRRGGRSRLGNVTSMADAEFRVPGPMLVEGSVIQLTAEVIGSRDRATTERIRVEPGLLIEWVIEEAIRHSNYFVSRRY